MHKTIMISLFVLTTRTALSSPVIEYFANATAETHSTRFVSATLDRPIDPAGPGAVTVYDNYTAPGEGGQSIARGVYASLDHVIQDDIGSPISQSQMSAYYILFSNRSSVSRLSRFSYSVEFVALTGQSLGVSAFTVDLSLFPLPTQSTGVLGWPDGSLLTQNIFLPNEFFIRQRLFDPIGISANDLGVPYGGPQTVGSSSSGFLNQTTNQFADLGSSNSLMFRIRGNMVPTPSTTSLLLATSTLLTLRRRR